MSSSDGADFTHITVVRLTPSGQKQKVWATELHGESYPEQMRLIAKLFSGPRPVFNCTKIFADYTGVGAPVIQTLKSEYGMINLTGIIFNASDQFTNSGMNMKNVMFAQMKQDIDNDKFKYPTEDLMMKSAPEKKGFYHKMVINSCRL